MQSQLALILSENGATGKAASLMISGYASGMIAGRLLSGLALDRFPAKYIATASIAMAGIGLLILASGYNARPMVFAAVLISGVSFGAESDVIAYIIVSNFGARIYSTVHSITATGTAIASVIGAILLTVLLKKFGVYSPFLGVTGAIAIAASLLFLLIPRRPKVIDEHVVEVRLAEESTA
jgi:MFS family permease